MAHYERLRRDATEVSAGGRKELGLALFVRRGMIAWMLAWRKCASSITPPAPTRPAATPPVPADLRAQVATLLAGIILGFQQEATS